jgi:hypothetical protein
VTTTASPDERIAAIRDECARLGEDVTNLSDTELLLRHIDQAWAESRRHENNYNSLLQDQVKRDRSVYTAARREAAEQQNARGGLYLAAIVRRSATPITGLIYRISQLPDRPGPKVIEELRSAARAAQWTLDGVVTDRVLGEIAERDPEVKLTEAQAVEIQRLREFVTALGRKLHAKHGGKGSRDNGWRCDCSGCELIRAMDDAPAEQATSAATAA